jgi:hypothetical protein
MMLRKSLSLVRGQQVSAATAHIGWDVFLGVEKIDTVYYNRNCTAQYVRETLITHDKFDDKIVVRRSS